jgi:hypothetical protein
MMAPIRSTMSGWASARFSRMMEFARQRLIGLIDDKTF